MADVKDAKTETMGFEAEVSRLLHMMVHSVYSEREIFLRELISNASDACDKLRYEAQSNTALMEEGTDFGITVTADKKAKTITVADNGIGMNRDDLISHLGTIARSGTAKFMDQLTGDSKKDMQLIGQFGIGFYSVFMVADKVVVTTKKAGEAEAWAWESGGEGTYEISPAQKDWALSYCRQDPDSFQTYVEQAPRVVPVGERLNLGEERYREDQGLTPEELAICRAINLTPEAYSQAKVEMAQAKKRGGDTRWQL